VDAAVTDALAKGKPTIFLPVVHPHEAAAMALLHVDGVVAGVDVHEAPPFGIREPTDAYPPGHPRAGAPRASALDAGLDVLLLPGAAFDAAGRRLGRGGGYYDSFVASLAAARDAPPPLLVGLAFAQQLVPTVPTEAHDVGVDVLVTAGRGCVGTSARGRAAVGGG
jgi:5,10-methenyltetrahydrofolate synthetase